LTALRIMTLLRRWVDNGTAQAAPGDAQGSKQIDWPRVLPFVLLHLSCLAVFWVGASAFAVGACAALFALRMFAVTAFYHRYFSHRAFRTSRAAQFAFALLGASAAQRGPLWWASHHRHHHAHSDRAADNHSPGVHGFFWSHIGWFLARGNFAARLKLVPDLAAFPELRWLDRFDVVTPALLALALYSAGAWLERTAPELQTNGAQLLVWGFCVSTVALYHATFTVNSLAHRFGARRYATRDDSRNNPWLALLTFGEGWHNNHHHFPGAARQGFYWWEVDISYLLLRLLAAIGVVWDLRPVPPAVRAARRVSPGEARP
jgi:stearoyl-CoA desaturase (delta-9 desaturase)